MTPADAATINAAWITLGAVALTVLVGLLGAWIQGRREHAKWVRERRYEAYVAMIRTLNRWVRSEKSGEPWAKNDALAELTNDNAAFFLLGPQTVDLAGSKVADAVAAGDVAAAKIALEAFEKVARRALHVSDFHRT